MPAYNALRSTLPKAARGYSTLNSLAQTYGTGGGASVGSQVASAGRQAASAAPQDAATGFLAENADLFGNVAEGFGHASKAYDAAMSGPGFSEFTSGALDTLGGAGTAADVAASVGMASAPVTGTGASTMAGGIDAAVNAGMAGTAGTAGAAPLFLNPATMWAAPVIGGIISGLTSKNAGIAGIGYDPETGYSMTGFNRGDFGNELEDVLPGFLENVNRMNPQRGGDATSMMGPDGPTLSFNRDMAAKSGMQMGVAHDDDRYPRAGDYTRSGGLTPRNLMAGPITPQDVMSRRPEQGTMQWGERAPTLQDFMDQRSRK